jgi:hypothetical protein
MGAGEETVGWPPSTVNRPPFACGLRSAVGGRQAVSKRLRVRSRIRNRGKRDMGNLLGAFL